MTNFEHMKQKICQKEYGECGNCSCNDRYSERYLEWCRKEYQGQKKRMAAVIKKVASI